MTLEQIYRQQFRFVWVSLARLGVPERDLPDAVQDVFVIVHRKLADFRHEARVETWLYGIALRVASGRRRSAAARRETLDMGDDDRRADSASSPAQITEQRERAAIAQAIVTSMPIEQRAVFVLFEVEGLSSAAVAERLELPIGTVYSRLRLARERFRREVDRLNAQDRFALTGDST